MVHRILVKANEPCDIYISNSTGKMIMTILNSHSYSNVVMEYSTQKPVNQLFKNLISSTGGFWCTFQGDYISIMGKTGERLKSGNRFEKFQKEECRSEVSCN